MKRKMSRHQTRSLYSHGLRQMSRRPVLGLFIIVAAFGIFLAQEYFWGPAPGPISEASFTATVFKVSDGDTITVRTADRREAKLRFYGVDAPELDQPYGPEAKKFLENLLSGREVAVERRNQDQYGRLVGRVFVDGQAVDELMVEAGRAWVYEQYCDRAWCGGLRQRQALARKNKLGLWRDARPVAPWVWRQKKK